MSAAPGPAMEAEFDDMAAWTADAVATLGPDHAEPAACRGTASPAALDWLSRGCRLGAGTRLVDVGGGMGGPAAYARRHHGSAPLIVEPMPAACRAARRMFDLPVLVGDGAAVPLRSGSAEVVWCLGVLCTTTEKAPLLAELHRLLAGGGLLGLFVLLAETPDPPDPPEGNAFPTATQLDDLLAGTGFTVLDATDLADLPASPGSWRERLDRVEEEIAAAHSGTAEFARVQEQENRMAALVEHGHVRGRLLVATPTPA